MRAALALAIVCSMPVTLLAQSSRAVESGKNPSLLEVAARVQRIVEAHEAALAAEKAMAGKEVAKSSRQPTTTATPAQRVRPAQRIKTPPRIGLNWRVTLVWPEELRERQ